MVGLAAGADGGVDFELELLDGRGGHNSSNDGASISRG
jgi:hypothetical protein